MVNGGNSLFPKEREVTQADLLTAQKILHSLSVLKIQYSGIGPYDLKAGIAFLLDNKQPMPTFLSANVRYLADNQPVFPAYDIHFVGKKKLAFIGVTAMKDFSDEKIYIHSPQDDLHQAIEEVQKETPDSIIVLSSLTMGENTSLAQLYPEISLIISSDHNVGNVPPKIVGQTLITQTQNRGRTLGELDIWLRGKGWLSYENKEMKVLQDQQTGLQWQIRKHALLKKQNPGNQEYNTAFKELEDRLAEITTKLQKMEQKQIDLQEEGFSSFDHTFHALTMDIKEDFEIRNILQGGIE